MVPTKETQADLQRVSVSIASEAGVELGGDLRVRPQSVLVLCLTVLLATIAFGMGAALEKATPLATNTQTSTANLPASA
jgi:hypothetical protein